MAIQLGYEEDVESDTSSIQSQTRRLLSSQHQQQYTMEDAELQLLISRYGRQEQKDVWISRFLWGIVIFFQVIIVTLLLLRRNETKTSSSLPAPTVVETGSDINGLYQTLSHTYTFLKPQAAIYMPNMTSNDDRMEVRRRWDLLMPLGSGSVAIPNYREHPLLGEPISDDPIRSGPLYEASWTHALHCLYYTVDSYHQLVVNANSTVPDPVHAGHCFEYLRNSILCNLDMTLEGSQSTDADKSRGQGHVCRNRDEAVAWIEARRVDDLQDIVGP